MSKKWKSKRPLLHLLKKLGVKSAPDRGTLMPEDLMRVVEMVKSSYGQPSSPLFMSKRQYQDIVDGFNSTAASKFFKKGKSR